MLNRGTLPFLPDDAVVEVQAAVGPDGPVPLPVPEPDPLFAGLIASLTAYEGLALEAALRGGRERVFRALLAHPLIGQHEYADALKAIDEHVAGHQRATVLVQVAIVFGVDEPAFPTGHGWLLVDDHRRSGNRSVVAALDAVLDIVGGRIATR